MEVLYIQLRFPGSRFSEPPLNSLILIMAPIWKLAARFATVRWAVAGTLQVVWRNEVVLIVEMRILEFLVAFGERLNRVFRLITHGLRWGEVIMRGQLSPYYMTRIAPSIGRLQQDSVARP